MDYNKDCIYSIQYTYSIRGSPITIYVYTRLSLRRNKEDDTLTRTERAPRPSVHVSFTKCIIKRTQDEHTTNTRRTQDGQRRALNRRYTVEVNAIRHTHEHMHTVENSVSVPLYTI